jgi:hypothetical protein
VLIVDNDKLRAVYVELLGHYQRIASLLGAGTPRGPAAQSHHERSLHQSRAALVSRRTIMMLQIGYFSSAAGPQDASTVHRILVEARKANRLTSITGLLVAGGGRYLQIIEGPNVAVKHLHAKLRADHRHIAVVTFLKHEVEERSFEG